MDNAEKHRESARRYRENHRDRVRASQLAYVVRHIDEVRAKGRARSNKYRADHREEALARLKQYHETHKEQDREYRSTVKYKERANQRQKEYYQLHKERIKAAACRTGKIVRTKQRFAVLWHYSNGTMACVKCEFSDIRALVLDHINGGGTEHRREMGNGINVWLWLARHGFPPGYQILCANCNAIKAREENEYGSNSLIGMDWRSKFDWKKQMKELGLHDRGRAWELPLEMRREVEK